MSSSNTATRVAIVIPSRHGSTSFPGKPLADIAGKPTVQDVYERASEVTSAHIVVVATDDERVADAVRTFGGTAILTASQHPSGTDRLGEVMKSVQADLYVNLQGDEPLVRPSDIDLLIQGMLADPSVHVGTLCHAIDARQALDPNTVKVVVASNSDALYFSRAPIPYPRDADGSAQYLKHVGVYAYRRKALSQYANLPQPMIEHAEKLEQLRLLAAGMRIRAFRVEPANSGLDKPEYLGRVRALMSRTATNTIPSLANTRLVITDVDGVLTNGQLHYDAQGESLKSFHVRDGLGMRLLEESGVRVAVLSGRSSGALTKRVHDLGITLSAFGVKDKHRACLQLMEQAGATPAETVCIGDDSIDLPAFAACGLSFAVADAPGYIKAQASETLKSSGGNGAFRELADRILDAQGNGSVFRHAAGYQAVMAKMHQ